MTLSPEITAAIDALIDATLRVALEDVPELEVRLAKAEYAARAKLESLIESAIAAGVSNMTPTTTPKEM